MGQSSRVDNVVKNTVSGIVQRIVAIFSNFIIQVVFIRLLGLQYAGVSSVFTSVISVLSLAELGISTAIVYNLYKPIAQNDYKTVAAYMNFYGKAYRIIALAVLGVGLTFVPFINLVVKEIPDVKENIRIIFLLFLIDSAASYLFIYKSTVLVAAQKQRIITNIQTAFYLVKCATLVLVLLIWRSYYAYLVLSIFITFLQNLLISRQADRMFPQIVDRKQKLGVNEKATLFKNIRAMFLYKVSGVILNGTDNVIISRYIGTGMVGQCSNYNFIINNVYNLVMQFSSATSAAVGNLATENDAKYQYTVFRQLNFISFWLYSFTSISILVISGPFVSLFFGASTLLPEPVIIVLVIDYYMKGMMSPISSYRTSNGLFVQGKYRPLIMAITNVFLSLLLMHWMGLIGVFLATIISRALTQVWFDPYIIYKYLFHRKVTEYLLQYLFWMGFTAVMGCVTYFIAEWLSVSSLLATIFIRGGICLFLPNAVLILVFHRIPEFKQTVAVGRHLLSKALGRFSKR